jgi:subtilisin family serine protease
VINRDYTFADSKPTEELMIRRFLAILATTTMLAVGLAAPAQAVPVEPAYTAINVNAAWSKNILGDGVTVAMIDQGVNLQHEYFEGQIIDGFCIYQNTNSALCPNGTKFQTGIEAASQRRDSRGALIAEETHGNMVAGLVVGKPNSVAPGGVAPNAKLVMANTDMQPASVVAALEYFYANRVKYNIVAVSMSFGILGLTSRQDLLSCNTNPVYAQVRASLKKLRDAGVIPFAAAGNSYYLNSIESWAPTCLNEAVSVGSVDDKGQIAIYNTMSTKVELLAPDHALSAVTFGYQKASGTSAAAPMVAASYALMRQQFPSHSAEVVLSAMKQAGKKLDDVIVKQIPMVDLAATQTLLTNTAVGTSPSTPTTPVAGQKVTVGTFNGYIAIYTQGFEGRRMSAKVAGQWLSVNPITLVPGKTYSLTRRNTGAGYDVRVEVWIDGVKQNLTVGGVLQGDVVVVRTR